MLTDDLSEDQVLMLRSVAALSLVGFSSDDIEKSLMCSNVNEIMDEYAQYLSCLKVDMLANISDDKDLASRVLFDRTVYSSIQFLDDVRRGGIPPGVTRDYDLDGPVPWPSRISAATSLIKMWADINKAGVVNIEDEAEGPAIPKPSVNRNFTVLEMDNVEEEGQMPPV